MKYNPIEIYNLILKSQYGGVDGVLAYESQKDGPVLGITICTHGNEPSGLYVAGYLEEYLKKNPLAKGKIILVLNNLQATDRYITLRYKEGVEDISALASQSRYIDINMNRLPENLESGATSNLYEISRARELLPIWRKFDVSLDIHSTSQKSQPMIITSNKYDKRMVANLPIEVVISNIERVQIGKPAYSFYGSSDDTLSLGIETGFHESEESFRTAIICVRSILHDLGMIEDVLPTNNISKKKEYQIVSSVCFSDNSYELVRVFKNFEPIKGGELLAKSHKSLPDIFSPENGVVVFAPVGTLPYNFEEEVLFIAKNVK